MSPEAARRLAALVEHVGARTWGPRWRRVLRQVSRLPEGDAADRELHAVLAAGDFDVVNAALDEQGVAADATRLGALDLISEMRWGGGLDVDARVP